jgi:hypothetical protein
VTKVPVTTSSQSDVRLDEGCLVVVVVVVPAVVTIDLRELDLLLLLLPRFCLVIRKLTMM